MTHVINTLHMSLDSVNSGPGKIAPTDVVARAAQPTAEVECGREAELAPCVRDVARAVRQIEARIVVRRPVNRRATPRRKCNDAVAEPVDALVADALAQESKRVARSRPLRD